MNTIKFDWDEKKSASNLKKHAVSFEEAQSVFDDDLARLIPDPDHSDDEERFILLGLRAPLIIGNTHNAFAKPTLLASLAFAYALLLFLDLAKARSSKECLA